MASLAIAALLTLVGCRTSPDVQPEQSYEEFVELLLSDHYMGWHAGSLEEAKVVWREFESALVHHDSRLLREFPALMRRTDEVEVLVISGTAFTPALDDSDSGDSDPNEYRTCTQGQIAFFWYTVMTRQRKGVDSWELTPEDLLRESRLAESWVKEKADGLSFDPNSGRFVQRSSSETSD